MAETFDVETLEFNTSGLIPVIVQDDANSEVLMMAWMNREAIDRTLTGGRMVYWSRSRREYWRKGDTSGHTQQLVRLSHDCDSDVLLARVIQAGAACHTGTRSCFDDRDIYLATPAVEEVQK